MKILTIFLNLVYISSGIYFLINKNILNFALCIFCLVSSIILNYLRKISFIKTNSLYSVCNLFLFFATILGSCFDTKCIIVMNSPGNCPNLDAPL